MRTTLTLDDDVAAKLEQLRARRQRPFKEVVNEALRAGLLVMEGQPAPRNEPSRSRQTWAALGSPTSMTSVRHWRLWRATTTDDRGSRERPRLRLRHLAFPARGGQPLAGRVVRHRPAGRPTLVQPADFMRPGDQPETVLAAGLDVRRLGQVQAWVDAEPAWIPLPTARHRAVVGGCLAAPGLWMNDVPDAGPGRVRYRARLASSDGGFARFSDLNWFNALT